MWPSVYGLVPAAILTRHSLVVAPVCAMFLFHLDPAKIVRAGDVNVSYDADCTRKLSTLGWWLCYTFPKVMPKPPMCAENVQQYGKIM